MSSLHCMPQRGNHGENPVSHYPYAALIRDESSCSRDTLEMKNPNSIVLKRNFFDIVVGRDHPRLVLCCSGLLPGKILGADSINLLATRTNMTFGNDCDSNNSLTFLLHYFQIDAFQEAPSPRLQNHKNITLH